jgi:sulfite reductase beta subunit-like hemoprotein
MQWKLEFARRSEDEYLKDNGVVIDYDEIARKGKMSAGDKLISKWYGIYASRQPGNHMARVCIQAGVLTSAQGRLLSRIAENYAQGKISITTRQAIQLHWLKTARLPDMLRELNEEALSTFHGCGDVARNMVCCPLAETCKYRRFDVRPIAKKVAKYLGDCRDLDNLPRKFKPTFSGCVGGCAQPYINCFSAIGVVRKDADGNDEFGFKIVIGGGMGWKPFVAQELFSFVPIPKIARVARAVALLFRDHGDRYDRTKSRLKFVVDRLGIDECREIVLQFLRDENVSTDGLETGEYVESGIDVPERPLMEPDPVGTDGKVTVTAIVPKGEMTHLQFKGLAEVSEAYGDKRMYTTQRQNLAIRGIDPAKVDEAKLAIREVGFETEGVEGLRDIVPCVGTTYCPKAVSKTRDLFDLLQPVVKQKKYDEIWDKVQINITGCPNSCSPYRIVDIGFRGMRIREGVGSVEGYEILLGGTQTDFGRKLGEYKLSDCPKIVETLLNTYLELREGDETFTDCIKRVGFGQ